MQEFVYIIRILLFEGVCLNYRHPGPRRVWEGGSEPPFLHHFRLCGHSGHSRHEFPEAIFCAQAWYLSKIDLENVSRYLPTLN